MVGYRDGPVSCRFDFEFDPVVLGGKRTLAEIYHRRSFLGTAAGGAAAGLAMATSGAMAQDAADARQERRVVVGVMGLSRGAHLAGVFAKQPGTLVKYVCDVDAHRAAACAKSVASAVGTAPQAIGDFRRILDDAEVDALVCATPNHWHAPATILACTAGKHVYVEKPCSHNPAEGEWMVAAARKHKRAVQMGTQRRSGPGTRAAIDRLAGGAIGRIYLVQSWYNSARGSIGLGKPAAVPSYLDYDLWQGPAPRRPYFDNRLPYNWHWFWHWGNGELGNNGVHTLDLCRWGLGVEHPTRVTSSGGRYAFDDDQETPDTHIVCFEFEGDRAITWRGLSCNRHGDGFVTFIGDNGALDLAGNGSHILFDKRGKEIDRFESESVGESEHIANFLDAVRKNDPSDLNAEIAEGHKSTLLCHLGNIAHRTGRSLVCDPKDGHIVGDEQAMALWRRDYEPGWAPKV